MLNFREIDHKIISMGDAVRSEVLYETNMRINVGQFFFLKMQKEFAQERFLNYNLYKFRV